MNNNEIDNLHKANNLEGKAICSSREEIQKLMNLKTQGYATYESIGELQEIIEDLFVLIRDMKTPISASQVNKLIDLRLKYEKLCED